MSPSPLFLRHCAATGARIVCYIIRTLTICTPYICIHHVHKTNLYAYFVRSVSSDTYIAHNHGYTVTYAQSHTRTNAHPPPPPLPMFTQPFLSLSLSFILSFFSDPVYCHVIFMRSCGSEYSCAARREDCKESTTRCVYTTLLQESPNKLWQDCLI